MECSTADVFGKCFCLRIKINQLQMTSSQSKFKEFLFNLFKFKEFLFQVYLCLDIFLKK